MSDSDDREFGYLSGFQGHYDPRQPRVPRGHPGGGQWTSDRSMPLSDLAELRPPDVRGYGNRALLTLEALLDGKAPLARPPAGTPSAAEHAPWQPSTLERFVAAPSIDANWIDVWTADAGGASLPLQLAAMSWEAKRNFLFGQRQFLFEGGGGWGNRGGSMSLRLPRFLREEGTSGVLRTSKGDIELVSGKGGPASSMLGRPGFNRWTLDHVEGHAAAEMWKSRLGEATLHINNPTICAQCVANLHRMLPPGAKLHIVLPGGTIVTFEGPTR